MADWISEALRSGDFEVLRFTVAFAKSGALSRLASDIKKFSDAGGRLEAVFGIDLCGTSKQALQFGLDHFDSVHIWHHPSVLTTFHPKAYLFHGHAAARLIIGSNNLTVGGTETNAEAATRVDYSLPAERALWNDSTKWWAELVEHENSIRLTQAILASLEAEGLLADESVLSFRGLVTGTGKESPSKHAIFPASTIAPPSPAPRKPVQRAGQRRSGRRVQRAVDDLVPKALAIQVVPHHNGEIFLSKIAINQHPKFFGFPFTGRTVPKVRNNRPYPQRTPDPIVNWNVYDRAGNVSRTLIQYGLNTVFYDKKGEIRITVPPDVARAIPALSILQMSRPASGSAVDYVCDVFPPNSDQHAALLSSCNQEMPSGGGNRARRFGWL